jgi:hypothetical protein
VTSNPYGELNTTVIYTLCGHFSPILYAMHKDVFSKSVEEATSPNYLKCNPPSDDYTKSGTGKRGDGNGR